jgi:hypothetical protein
MNTMYYVFIALIAFTNCQNSKIDLNNTSWKVFEVVQTESYENLKMIYDDLLIKFKNERNLVLKRKHEQNSGNYFIKSNKPFIVELCFTFDNNGSILEVTDFFRVERIGNSELIFRTLINNSKSYIKLKKID